MHFVTNIEVIIASEQQKGSQYTINTKTQVNDCYFIYRLVGNQLFVSRLWLQLKQFEILLLSLKDLSAVHKSGRRL